MKITIALIGASGFGSEVMPLLEDKINTNEKLNPNLIYVDSDIAKTELNGYKVYSEEDFLEMKVDKKLYNIAISNPQIRHTVQERMKRHEMGVFSIESKDFQCINNVRIGEGSIILPGVLCTSNITIGDFFHCNPKCSIAHDVVIGDFVTIAPGAMINGNVFIDDLAYIGSGATIKQGISIGKGSVIGMGSVVVKDVEPGSTVVGNPAIILNKDNIDD